ncbi:MAG: tetratricopeptide repeat protein [Candidatus Acidiferrum sp.]
MTRNSSVVVLISFLLCISFYANPLAGQGSKSSAAPAASVSVSAEKSIALAEQGHCKEAIPELKRVLNSERPAEVRKKAGVLGLRCSMTLDNRDSALDFLRLLNHQFPQDPELLFISVHTYSDLSSRTALELGRVAPQSLPAHKLNAEALEIQGKWDEAEREYQEMILKNPDTPGLHYLLGRLLLSRPGSDAKSAEQAKQEFQKEIQIDPRNAGAEYILGEMARQESQWEEAVLYFSKAAKLDSNFGDAYLGWGFCLVTLKRYEEAVPPLRRAVELEQGNPSAHYNLAIALNRSGQKAEADEQFAIHRKLTQNSAPSEQKKE